MKDGFNGAPNLIILSHHDSADLYQMLSNIRHDNLHSKFVSSQTYRDKEINSILEFITYTFKPHY